MDVFSAAEPRAAVQGSTAAEAVKNGPLAQQHVGSVCATSRSLRDTLLYHIGLRFPRGDMDVARADGFNLRIIKYVA